MYSEELNCIPCYDVTFEDQKYKWCQKGTEAIKDKALGNYLTETFISASKKFLRCWLQRISNPF